MIGGRKLINEIPSGKFHSALMTSYSINLYYWESQLLKTLSRKGINYVSAVVDSECLSEQLYYYNSAREGKAPKFSLHGFQSEGAFHPKIQFYVGREVILALVGSGNISISGHGKNLEIWNPIMVDSVDSLLFPLIQSIWGYLSNIYKSLGSEATDIIETVKENCELLKNLEGISDSECNVGDGMSLRFFANGDKSLMEQCRQWIAGEEIQDVVIMSPFHDPNGSFINGMLEQYNPKTFDLILQKGFGFAPEIAKVPNDVNIIEWDDMRAASSLRQKFFHAKCVFLQGEHNSYLICGSANSSIAAFGKVDKNGINHEACIGYKIPKQSFYDFVGIQRPSPIERLQLTNYPTQSGEAKTIVSPVIWIKESVLDYRQLNVYVESKHSLSDLKLCIYSGNRKSSLSYDIEAIADDVKLGFNFDGSFVPILVEIVDKSGNLLSNRQFVISSMTMMENNPSPENSQHRKMCNEIESGRFITDSIFNFVKNILLQKSTTSASSTDVPKNLKETDSHQYDTYDAYMAGNKAVNTALDRMRRHGTMSPSLKSTMLMDSIMSYVTRSSTQGQMKKIDHEQTEDINTSQGTVTVSESKLDIYTDVKSNSIKAKVIAMFDKYLDLTLAFSKLPKTKQQQICLSDALNRFNISLLYISRCVSYRYDTDTEKNQSLAHIPAGIHTIKSLTYYLYKVIDTFSLLTFRYKFKTEDKEYAYCQIDNLKPQIFPFAIAMISVFDWLNEGNKAYEDYYYFYKHSSLMNIMKAIGSPGNLPSVQDVYNKIDNPIQEMPGFDQSIIEGHIRQNLEIMKEASGRVYFSDEYGYVSLKPYKREMYLPCSLIFDYNISKSSYCPDSVYHGKVGRILQLTKKSYF